MKMDGGGNTPSSVHFRGDAFATIIQLITWMLLNLRRGDFNVLPAECHAILNHRLNRAAFHVRHILLFRNLLESPMITKA